MKNLPIYMICKERTPMKGNKKGIVFFGRFLGKKRTKKELIFDRIITKERVYNLDFKKKLRTPFKVQRMHFSPNFLNFSQKKLKVLTLPQTSLLTVFTHFQENCQMSLCWPFCLLFWYNHDLSSKI